MILTPPSEPEVGATHELVGSPVVLTPSRTASTATREALEETYGSVESAEGIRAQERQLALASTYHFAKAVCGMPDLVPDFHAAMCEWIERPTRLKCGLAPRGHLKSHVWTIAYTLRRVTANPNMRCLISNETDDNIVKFMNVMKGTIQSQVYRWLFPECVPEFTKRLRWNANQIELRREANHPQATIEGISVGGASTSNHYELIVNDDPVGKRARDEPSTMEKAIDHRKLCWSLLVDPSKNEIFDIGTRWSPRDYMDFVIRTVDNLDFFKLTIFKPNGEPLWPDRFPPEVIRQIRRDLGPELFALQYLNDSLAEGAVDFNPEHLRTWTARTDDSGTVWIILRRSRGEGGDLNYKLEDLFRFEVVDAGLSPESPDARTAVITLGVTPKGPEDEPYNIVLLGARAKKTAPDATVQFAWEEFQRLDPISCSIEVFGGHQTFFYWLRQRYPNMRVRKLKTDTGFNAKHRRIRAFYPFVEQHRFFVSEDQVEFLEEFVAFPNGRTVDLLDAVSYGPQVWSVPPRPEDRRQEPQEFLDEEAQEETRGRTANSITGYLALFALVGLLTLRAALA